MCTGGLTLDGKYETGDDSKTHLVPFAGSSKTEIEIQIGNDRPSTQYCLGNIYLDDIKFFAQRPGSAVATPTP